MNVVLTGEESENRADETSIDFRQTMADSTVCPNDALAYAGIF